MLQFACFACDRRIRSAAPAVAHCSDEQSVFVGADCFRKIKAAGKDGYRPPKGGPRLFISKPSKPEEAA